MESIEERAQWALNHAMGFHTPQDGYDFIVKAIVADICDRRGLRQEWESIDGDIQGEIMNVWREIIRGVIDPI